MTQEEKLKALVKRAMEGGLKPKHFSWIPEDEQALLNYWFTADNYKAVILNHDFARALFGNQFDESVAQYIPKTGESDNPSDIKDWYGKAHYNGPTFEYHLMMAVISPDPIDYLYNVVFGEKE
jgi:hypothetical protein